MLFEPIHNLRLIYDFFFKSLQKQYHGVPEKKDINQKAQCANKTIFNFFLLWHTFLIFRLEFSQVTDYYFFTLPLSY